MAKVYAHRGCSSLAPENTLAALEAAAKYGFTYAEFDLQLTADHELILFHDTDMLRITGKAGRPCDETRHEISKRDAGSHYALTHKNERIPSLKQVLKRAESLPLKINFELKMNHSDRYPPEQYEDMIVKVLLKEMNTSTLIQTNAPRLSSFSHACLSALHDASYPGDLALISDHFRKEDLDFLNAINARAYHLNYLYLTQQHIQVCHSKGLEVLGYTINSKPDAQAFLDMGGDGFFTDRPDLLEIPT